MPTRRAIRAVLHNFLETYASRYSDHDGYWLFGLIVDKFERVEFDLLTKNNSIEDSIEEPLIAFAAGLAAIKFSRQLRLAKFSTSILREARLILSKVPGDVQAEVNGRERTGQIMRFGVRAIPDRGRSFECEKLVFVAPHDPAVEWRSTRRP